MRWEDGVVRIESRVVFAVAAALFAGCRAPDEPVAVTCPAVDGSLVAPLRAAPGELNVLVFVTTDCPIANKCAPEIEAIRREYGARGVRMFLVHVDPDVDDVAARAHAAEYGHGATVLRDPQHRLVAATGVEVTPEVSVHDDTGAQRYRGRIDDRFAQLGTRRPAANHRDLREALDAILAGEEPAVPVTEAVGCLIADFR